METDFDGNDWPSRNIHLINHYSYPQNDNKFFQDYSLKDFWKGSTAR